MASLFGITSAKYQYAIDEYYRIKKEVGSCLINVHDHSVQVKNMFVSFGQREEEKEENRLSEEAERSFEQLRSREEVDEPDRVEEEAATARPDVTYQVENENQAAPSTIRVPAIVTAT